MPDPAKSKSAIVEQLLRRRHGVSLTELTDATGWKPHSARAFLSGLRKKGARIQRETLKTKGTVYRIEKSKPDKVKA
ncbi:MAG: DUF3489 domain-containing protein [Erythrobacter sp.]|uniref:DUF3489 domain-containing protein n=1 Tax=Erythrobacter sp. TaxID=1042 RepID=UPI003C726D54